MPTLEQQLADAIDAQNRLTQAVALYKSQIDSAVVAQKQAYDVWRDGVRKEFPAVNLLSNSRFTVDTNSDGMPDGFYSYYPCPSSPPTLSLIGPDSSAAVGSDAKIAYDVLSAALGETYWGHPGARVLKAAFPSNTPVSSSGQWSLNQIYPNNARLLSRGIYGYIKCASAPNAYGTYDCPGGATHIFGNGYINPADGVNKVVKFCPEPSMVTSACLGFLFSANGISAGTTIYLAAPWYANGFVKDYPSSIEGR